MSLTGQKVRQKDPPPLRCKAHIAFVKAKPCLICGRQPSEAHHVRLGLRTMGRRVCDSKCVPLCAYCHRGLHKAGDEKRFWPLNGFFIELRVFPNPLDIAAQLWHERTGRWPEWYDQGS